MASGRAVPLAPELDTEFENAFLAEVEPLLRAFPADANLNSFSQLIHFSQETKADTKTLSAPAVGASADAENMTAPLLAGTEPSTGADDLETSPSTPSVSPALQAMAKHIEKIPAWDKFLGEQLDQYRRALPGVTVTAVVKKTRIDSKQVGAYSIAFVLCGIAMLDLYFYGPQNVFANNRGLAGTSSAVSITANSFLAAGGSGKKVVLGAFLCVAMLNEFRKGNTKLRNLLPKSGSYFAAQAATAAIFLIAAIGLTWFFHESNASSINKYSANPDNPQEIRDLAPDALALNWYAFIINLIFYGITSITVGLLFLNKAKEAYAPTEEGAIAKANDVLEKAELLGSPEERIALGTYYVSCTNALYAQLQPEATTALSTNTYQAFLQDLLRGPLVRENSGGEWGLEIIGTTIAAATSMAYVLPTTDPFALFLGSINSALRSPTLAFTDLFLSLFVFSTKFCRSGFLTAADYMRAGWNDARAPRIGAERTWANCFLTLGAFIVNPKTLLPPLILGLAYFSAMTAQYQATQLETGPNPSFAGRAAQWLAENSLLVPAVVINTLIINGGEMIPPLVLGALLIGSLLCRSRTMTTPSNTSPFFGHMATAPSPLHIPDAAAPKRSGALADAAALTDVVIVGEPEPGAGTPPHASGLKPSPTAIQSPIHGTGTGTGTDTHTMMPPM